MQNLLTIAYVAVAVLLLFGAAIFIHEWGHYWVALKRGLTVEEFAIGFGPKVFSWKRGDVLWTVRAIPAGGFVKLPQMITSEALEGASSTGEPLPPISPFSKTLVAFAGPMMNVVFALAIATFLYFVGLPILVNPSIVGPVKPGTEAANLGLQEGDRIVAVNGKHVDSWQEISQETVLSTTNVLTLTTVRGSSTNLVRATAKTIPNTKLKWLDIPSREIPTVGRVQPGRPAEKAGIRPGDRFVEVDGVPVFSNERMIELISAAGGRPVKLLVNRGGELKSFTVTPAVDPDAKDGQKKVARIGVEFTGGIYRVQRPGPTPLAQIEYVLGMMGKTINALYHSKKTGVGASDLSGPVGILGSLASQVMIDYRLALSFMVLLNINLAILNLLPVPVLDGGHITMAMYEAVFRRPVSLKFQEYATGFFAILLIGFMLYVTVFGDLRRWSIMRSMLQRGSQTEVIDGTNSNDAPAQP
jgi:regulator of sigma E protease